MFKNREERGEREGKIIKGGKKHTERNWELRLRTETGARRT